MRLTIDLPEGDWRVLEALAAKDRKKIGPYAKQVLQNHVAAVLRAAKDDQDQ